MDAIMRTYFIMIISLVVLIMTTQISADNLDVSEKTQVAKVNSTSITSGDVNQLILTDPQFYRVYQQSQGNPAQFQHIRSIILDALIDRALLLEIAEKSAVANEKQVLSDRVAEIEKRNGGAEKLKKAIQDRGANYDVFKTNLRDDILIAEFIRADWGKEVSVSDADARKAFDENSAKFDTPSQVRARHILISVDKSATQAEQDAAEKQIKELFASARKAPDSFADLAKQHSKCPSAAAGGDLGFFSAKQMVPEFSKVAFALKPGEIGGPVRTQFGWHIIKAEEVKPGTKADFNAVREQIVHDLKAERLTKLAEQKMAKLRAAAKIEKSAEYQTKQ